VSIYASLVVNNPKREEEKKYKTKILKQKTRMVIKKGEELILVFFRIPHTAAITKKN